MAIDYFKQFARLSREHAGYPATLDGTAAPASVIPITQRPRDPHWPMMRAANAACDLARVLHQVDRLDREQPHETWDACPSEDRVRYLGLAEYLLHLLAPIVRKGELPALDALTEGEEQP